MEVLRRGRSGRAEGLWTVVVGSTGEGNELMVFWKEFRELDLGGPLDSSEGEWIEDDDEEGMDFVMLRLCLEATMNPLFLAKDEAGGGDTEASPSRGVGDIVLSLSKYSSDLSTVDDACSPSDTPAFVAPKSNSNPFEPAAFNATSLCLLLNTATGTFLSSTIVSSASSSSSSSASALLLLQSPDRRLPFGGKTGRSTGVAMSSSVEAGGGVVMCRAEMTLNELAGLGGRRGSPSSSSLSK